MTIKEAHAYMEDLQRVMTRYRDLFSEKFICANGMAILALEKQMLKDAQPEQETGNWIEEKENPHHDETH